MTSTNTKPSRPVAHSEHNANVLTNLDTTNGTSKLPDELVNTTNMELIADCLQRNTGRNVELGHDMWNMNQKVNEAGQEITFRFVKVGMQVAACEITLCSVKPGTKGTNERPQALAALE